MDFGARESQVRKPALPPPSWGSHFNTLASASSSTGGKEPTLRAVDFQGGSPCKVPGAVLDTYR